MTTYSKVRFLSKSGATAGLVLESAEIPCALWRVATSPRVNLAEPGVSALLRRGLVQKNWALNDASGEAVRLTMAGVALVAKGVA